MRVFLILRVCLGFSYLYIYKTETFEVSTIFPVSIIFKKLKIKLKTLFSLKKKPDTYLKKKKQKNKKQNLA